MRNVIRTRKFYLIFVLDAGLIVAAYFLSCFLRFEGQIPANEWKNFNIQTE